VQLIATAAAVVDILVVALAVVLAVFFGTRHSPCLGKCSAGVASGTTTRQGRGAGMVSPMAYSTPAWSLTFSKVVAMSQRHLVSSLSQSQSTLAARRKGDTRPLKGNVAKKKRSKSDTNDGSPQKGNAANKKRGNLVPDTRLPGRGVPTLLPRMTPITTTKRRGGERMMSGMRQNIMTKRMFFLSLMRFLE
jgi:hypothetical protein